MRHSKHCQEGLLGDRTARVKLHFKAQGFAVLFSKTAYPRTKDREKASNKPATKIEN